MTNSYTEKNHRRQDTFQKTPTVVWTTLASDTTWGTNHKPSTLCDTQVHSFILYATHMLTAFTPISFTSYSKVALGGTPRLGMPCAP